MRTFRIAVLLSLLTAAGAAAASISGVVRLVGSVPEIPPRASLYNTDVCGDQPRKVPSLLLGTNQAVANAIVYLGFSTVTSGQTNVPAVLNVVHCEILPRIQIMRSGSSLVLRNSDPTLHVLQVEMLNITNAPSLLLTAALPYAGFEKPFNLENFHEPRMLKVLSGNNEDGAVAYVAVLPHTYSALTDEQGRFVINGVPPGSYTLYIWHEVLGTTTRNVRVTAEHASSVTIEIPPPPAP